MVNLFLFLQIMILTQAQFTFNRTVLRRTTTTMLELLWMKNKTDDAFEVYSLYNCNRGVDYIISIFYGDTLKHRVQYNNQFRSPPIIDAITSITQDELSNVCRDIEFLFVTCIALKDGHVLILLTQTKIKTWKDYCTCTC